MSSLRFPRFDPSVVCDITATWNFTGGLKIDDVDVATTADVFDPTADESITGAWNFTNGLQKDGVDVATTADNFDPSSNETITGDWDFDGSLKANDVPVYGGPYVTQHPTYESSTAMNVSTETLGTCAYYSFDNPRNDGSNYELWLSDISVIPCMGHASIQGWMFRVINKTTQSLSPVKLLGYEKPTLGYVIDNGNVTVQCPNNIFIKGTWIYVHDLLDPVGNIVGVFQVTAADDSSFEYYAAGAWGDDPTNAGKVRFAVLDVAGIAKETISVNPGYGSGTFYFDGTNFHTLELQDGP